VLQDKENAVFIGTSIDELIRHHPFLKTPVFEAVRSTLGRIEDLGNAYIVPADIRHWYQLVPESAIIPPRESVEGDIAMDVDIETIATGSAADIVGIIDETSSESAGEKEDSSIKSHDNHVVSFIDVVGRVSQCSFRRSCINILLVFVVPRRSLPASSSLQGLCYKY
jgi:E3 ubiquitin-protein ligase HUWE1